jgi:hypothetical protein
MDSTKAISWGQAWAHCASTGSYWVWIAIFLIVGFIGLLVINASAKNANKDPYVIRLVWCILFTFLLGLAIFMRPSQVAANTSQASAARGQYLGY